MKTKAAQTITGTYDRKPRNLVAVAAHFRHGGAHTKTRKAQRRAEAVSLKINLQKDFI